MGAIAGGVIWGLGMTGRWWIERQQGWWSSRIAGHADPLMLISPLSWLACAVAGTAVMLLLSMVGRRFGWKGQALSLVLLAFYQAVRERVWIGQLIPALSYEPGVTQILGSAGMLLVAGTIAVLVTRLLGGPNAASRERK